MSMQSWLRPRASQSPCRPMSPGGGWRPFVCRSLAASTSNFATNLSGWLPDQRNVTFGDHPAKGGPHEIGTPWHCTSSLRSGSRCGGGAEIPGRATRLGLCRTNCAQCHTIDPIGPSSLSVAPPFRDLHERYPVETLEEALAEGIRTGHPSMPEFRLEPDQIGDLIAFLKSLE